MKLQAGWRGGYTRKIFQSRLPGSVKNSQVSEALRKSWSVVEQNLNENALFVFRTMFRLNPTISQFYPFARDEWNRVSYVDYNGSHAEQPSNSWFILFRDIFHVPNAPTSLESSDGSETGPVLMLPKIYCHLNNYLLKGNTNRQILGLFIEDIWLFSKFL